MSDSIKIFQNLSDDVIEFESKEQFMNYYERNKKEIDEMKTRGINVKFKIPGYKIGRKNNNLILIPTGNEGQSDKGVEKLSEKDITQLTTIDSKLDVINRRLIKIEEVLSYLFKLLNQS